MKREKTGFSLNDYKPVDKGDCKGLCDREVILLTKRNLVVCHGCKRILINKEK
jgi:hypothetical protein